MIVADSDDEDGDKTPSPKIPRKTLRDFGCVCVMWETGNESTHRRGLDGRVEVYCRDAGDVASGGYCYRDHLAALDCLDMMAGKTEDRDDDDEEIDDGRKHGTDVGEVQSSIRRTSPAGAGSLGLY